MKNKNAKQNKYSHPGRPRHSMRWPKSKQFTFTNIMDANGCDTTAGKHYGKKVGDDGCTLLTLRKNLARDNARKGHSLIVCLKETAEPNGESGLGRRAKLYSLRTKGMTSYAPVAKAVKVSTPKTAKVKTVKVKTPRVPKSTSQTPMADTLDKIHAILATPDAAPALTVPVVTITPEAAPVPAPVVETAPAPVVEAPVAPVVETAPAPVSTLVNS